MMKNCCVLPVILTRLIIAASMPHPANSRFITVYVITSYSIHYTKLYDLLFVLPVFSQDFAPVGAEWYYGESFAFSGDINYIKFRSEKDTLVNGIMCRKISKRHKIFCNDRPDTEYLFTRNDTVYFFDPNFGEFQVLYVLSAQPDDMWMIKVRDNDETIDTIKIIVDSLRITSYNVCYTKLLRSLRSVCD